MSKKFHDDWNNAVQIIKLENDLIHHRTTTAFAVHGFLFAAFCAVAVKLNDNLDSNWNTLLIIIEYIIPIIGIVASYLLRSGMCAALRQIRACDIWFKKTTECDSSQGFVMSDYPPLTGRRHANEYTEFTQDERNKINDISTLCVGMDRLPSIMSLVWVIVVIALTTTLCIKENFPYSLAVIALFVIVLQFSIKYNSFGFYGQQRSRSQGACCAGDVMSQANEAREITKKWVRLVSACKLEKQWTNERLGWFFTANGILLGSLAAIIKIYYDGNSTKANPPNEHTAFIIGNLGIENIVAFIILIGIVSSVSTVASVVSAAWMHHTWFGELVALIDSCNDKRVADGLTFGRVGRCRSLVARWVPVLVPATMLYIWFRIASKVYVTDGLVALFRIFKL
ncbi:MAG: hypothetical protein FD177_82 [Desulfovibrionaceae bacterium]|nr:MAG: hypothetical protein FD177_82 [Desulfovibrionaceae bacterium]